MHYCCIYSQSLIPLPFVNRSRFSFRPSFCVRIINDFDDGVLNAPPGVGLRQLLASKLRCEVMRVSKKFCGWACVGKRSFRPVRHPDGRASRVSCEEDDGTGWPGPLPPPPWARKFLVWRHRIMRYYTIRRTESRDCRHRVGKTTLFNVSVRDVLTPTLCKGGWGSRPPVGLRCVVIVLEINSSPKSSLWSP